MPGKATNPAPKDSAVPKLHAELRELILSTRERVARRSMPG